MRDGLQKLKDFPAEFRGMGEQIAGSVKSALAQEREW